jgi:hypothetical protein
MSVDRLKRLAIALAILIFLWGAVEILRQGSFSGTTPFDLPEFTIEEVDSVSIVRSVGDVRLIKVGPDMWTVNGYRAQEGGVEPFIELFGEEPRAELVAQNPTTHPRFEVDDASGRTLRVYRGDDVAYEVVVGKRGRDFQNVYLRRPGEDEVYLVRTRLVTFIDRTVDDWRDKSLAAIEPDSVASVEVTRGGSSYALRRSADGPWTMDGRQTADSAAVRRLLDQYASLNASGFPRPEQMDSVELTRPDRRVVLRDAASAVLVELAFDSATTGFWVARSGDSTVYRLDRFRVDQLTPADSTVRGAGE